jgi:hypothetical protein
MILAENDTVERRDDKARKWTKGMPPDGEGLTAREEMPAA